jgi:hypothetical protein
MLAAGAEAPSLGVKGCIMANPLVQNDGVTDHPQSGWLGFFRHSGKIQKHGSALIGAGGTGCKAPGLKHPIFYID